MIQWIEEWVNRLLFTTILPIYQINILHLAFLNKFPYMKLLENSSQVLVKSACRLIAQCLAHKS